MTLNTKFWDVFGREYLTGSNNNVCLCIVALPVFVTVVRADPAAERRE